MDKGILIAIREKSLKETKLALKHFTPEDWAIVTNLWTLTKPEHKALIRRQLYYQIDAEKFLNSVNVDNLVYDRIFFEDRFYQVSYIQTSVQDIETKLEAGSQRNLLICMRRITSADTKLALALVKVPADLSQLSQAPVLRLEQKEVSK